MKDKIIVLAKIKFDLRDPDEVYFARHEIESVLHTRVKPIKTISALFKSPPFNRIDDEVVHLISRLLYLGEVQGYLAKVRNCNLFNIIERVTFFREVYLIGETLKDVKEFLQSVGIKDPESPDIKQYKQVFIKELKNGKRLITVRALPLQTLFEYAVETKKLPAAVFRPKNSQNWKDYFEEKENGIEQGLQEMISHLQSGHHRSPHFGLGKNHISDFIDWASTDLRKPYLHYLHKYKGKGDPRISRALINLLKVNKGDTILDPFVGSGAFIADAPIMGINAIGVEILNIGKLIAEVKCNLNYNLEELRDTIIKIFNSLQRIEIDNSIKEDIKIIRSKLNIENLRTKAYENISSHLPKILFIKRQIDTIKNEQIRKFLLVLLSQQIVEFSEKRRQFDILTSFKSYVEDRYLAIYSTLKLAEMLNYDLFQGTVKIFRGDSTEMNFLANNSIDGILTSPPYFDALDYIGNNRVSIVILGFDEDLKYGSTKEFYNPEHRENKGLFPQIHYDFLDLPETSLNLLRLFKESRRSLKAEIVENYLKMMKLSFAECYRVLKRGKLYLMVISKYHTWIINKREERVDTSKILADLGESLGFKVVDVIEHGLSKADKGKINVEDILIFKKP